MGEKKPYKLLLIIKLPVDNGRKKRGVREKKIDMAWLGNDAVGKKIAAGEHLSFVSTVLSLKWQVRNVLT